MRGGAAKLVPPLWGLRAYPVQPRVMIRGNFDRQSPLGFICSTTTSRVAGHRLDAAGAVLLPEHCTRKACASGAKVQ
jgi:hypothetical protein